MSHLHGRSTRLGAGLIVVGALVLTTGFSLAAFAADKVVLCHRQGDGTFHTLDDVAPNSVAGHLAHGDHLGPCEGTTPTTEATTTSTLASTTSSEPTTTSTLASTTSSEATTTTTQEVGDVTITTAATPTSSPEDTETDVEDTAAAAETSTTTTPSSDPAEVGAVVDELPYTGAPTFLLIPGALLLIAGLLAVFVGWGFGGAGRAHLATEQGRFGLGLYRGRHEATRT
ncbi:MAG: hypothetical protein WAL25_01720 [Acidimicrobiia bacterium]